MCRWTQIFIITIAVVLSFTTAKLTLADSAGVGPNTTQNNYIPKPGTMVPHADIGDKIDLYTGALTINQTDITIPGNGPTIRVMRSYRGGTGDYHEDNLIGELADWSLNIPRIIGTINASADQLSAGTAWQSDRCSGTGAFDASYTGFHLEYNGKSRYLVPNGLSFMPDGTVAVTKDFWRVSCLSSILNGPGEGFVATTPNGTKITFAEVKYETASLWDPCNYGYGRDAITRVRAMMLATEVEDRFGNTIDYHYNASGDLTSITASDGRQVTFTYQSFQDTYYALPGFPTTYDLVTSASADGKTWKYSYTQKVVNTSFGGIDKIYLDSVLRPDGTSWKFNLVATDDNTWFNDTSDGQYLNNNYTTTGTVTTPWGAVVTYTTTTGPIGPGSGSYYPRANIPVEFVRYCEPDGPPGYPIFYLYTNPIIQSVQSKTVTEGDLSYTWSYGRTSDKGWYNTSTSPGATQKTVTVTSPEGIVDKYTFSIMFDWTEGQLLEHDVYASAADITPIRKTTYQYQRGTVVGSVAVPGINGEAVNEQVLPSVVTVSQDESTYTTEYLAYDRFNNPTSISRYNDFDLPRKNETFSYLNDTTNWVLGRLTNETVNSVSVLTKTYNDLDEVQEEDQFGLKKASYTYNAGGQVATVTDGRGDTTTLSNYYRGTPQLTQRPDGSSTSAVVNDDGTVASTTDARGYTTSYSYDALQRLSGISYPSNDTVAWAPVSISWQNVSAPPAGVSVGDVAMLRTRNDGHLETETYFDPLLRPVFEQRTDLKTGEVRDQLWRYDSYSHIVYASYPSSTGTPTDGVVTNYDAIGRVTSISDSVGTMDTYEYLSTDAVKVTNGNNKVTYISYQAFGAPSQQNPVSIASPEGQYTQIRRDVFGAMLSATQSGNNTSVSVTHSYIYDAHHRLCKSIDPETGKTDYGYDAASNLAWKAIDVGGSVTSCDNESVATPAQLTTFTYDAMNRLTAQHEPSGTDSVYTAYDQDGHVKDVTTPKAAWFYTYDGRGLRESQTLVVNGYPTPTSFHTVAARIVDKYDPQGHLVQRQYPDGLVTTFNPNAWGQPTQVGSYASDITYSPNGMVAGFTYGNGLQYSQTLDVRMRPNTIAVTGTAGDLVNLQYAYDGDNNVTYIGDGVTSDQSRYMGYDGLDRLTSVAGGWDGTLYDYRYSYDAVDNLREVHIAIPRGGSFFLPVQDIITTYNVDTNRIDGITGDLTRNYTYDAQGNLTSDGVHSFTYDVANRLTSTVGVAQYTYDGHGRRTITTKPDTEDLSVYDAAGNLAYTVDTASGVATDYLELQHKSLAQVSAGKVTYLHTDELGSPILATDGSGNELWREGYQPYGMKLDASVAEKIGFTGHVFDADTGLTDMGARLYDPLIGRFLSTDPKAFNGGSAYSFNRYAYANDNPYRYTDPNGRSPLEIAFLIGDAIQLGNALESGSGIGMAVANVAIDVVGVASPIPGISEAAHAVELAHDADEVVHAVHSGDELVHAADEGAEHVSNSVPKYARNKYKSLSRTEKKRVLKDNPTCVYCDKNSSTTVDHIRSQKQDWVEGGWKDSKDVRSARVNDSSNLTGACRSCNSSKNSKILGTEWIPPKDRL